MSNRPESVLSEATTLTPEQQQQQQQQQASSQHEPEDQNAPGAAARRTLQYYYVEPSKKGPQPDYVPKPKSKLSKLLSKFQSPAVKATLAKQDQAKAEDIRRGVKTTQVSDVGRSGNAWAATSLAP